jgi:ribosomal-protein-alanine N-acetyltransferase
MRRDGSCWRTNTGCSRAAVAQPVVLGRTPRLLLCQPAVTDADDLFAFMGDAEAMRYTQRIASPVQMRERLAAHEAQRSRVGYAPWTLRRFAEGDVVGWGGICDDPFDPGWGLEVAYFFAPQVWGQGYASELVAESTRQADIAGLPRLRAFSHPSNRPSQRVLEKSGFRCVGFVAPMNRQLYERTADSGGG